MRVLFLTRVLTHYRVAFHERLRGLLAESGIQYDLVHGQPRGSEERKADLAFLPWAKQVHNLYMGGSVVWQPAVRDVVEADLVILGQENSLLFNYPVQLLRDLMPARIALFGHGRNFQARRPNGAAERWKRFWTTRCHWWFGYTDETRRIVEGLGFPQERITIFGNAIDTRELQQAAERVTPERLAFRRQELRLVGKNIAIYVGGLYAEKQLSFLIEAADLVRVSVPDFELIVVGGGPDEQVVFAAAETRPWMKVTGPRFAADKAELMMLAQVFVMPGLVGLALLDAAACGLPVITTAYPYHSPEISYLDHGRNGLVVPDWQDVRAYAEAIVALLMNPSERRRMGLAARAAASHYTIDNMASRFATGVQAALISKK